MCSAHLVFANTVNKTLCRLTLIDAFSDTLSEVVAKTIPITITCVKAEAPVKTAGDTDVATINEFEAVALVHPKSYTFS